MSSIDKKMISVLMIILLLVPVIMPSITLAAEDEVVIKDPALADSIEISADSNLDGIVTKEELENVTYVSIWPEVESIEGLEGAKNLQSINIRYTGKQFDFSKLDLKDVYVSVELEKEVTKVDLSFLKTIKNVNQVNISGGKTDNVTINYEVLQDIPTLTALSIYGNDILPKNLDVLSTLTNLTSLQLYGGGVNVQAKATVDITGISKLSHLTDIYLNNIIVQNANELAKLQQLSYFNVSIANGLESITISENELLKLWYGAESSVNMESLNSLYLPNNENMRKLSNVIEAASGTPSPNPTPQPKRSNFQRFVEIGKNVGSRIGRTNASPDNSKKDAQLPSMIESRTLSSNEPTLINAKIYVNNTSRDFIIGVKTMTRLCDSDTMVRELIKAVENTNLAFKLIKWTKGELKFFRDIVFGISQAREDALNEKNGKGWFSAMRRRKQAAKTFIGGGRPLSPINTIVCTKYEVETVRAKTGIDLSESKNAKKLMKDLYLLGFCILDETNGTVEILLDGDATDGEFVFNTVAGLRRVNESSGGNVSLNDLRAFMKEVGNK